MEYDVSNALPFAFLVLPMSWFRCKGRVQRYRWPFLMGRSGREREWNMRCQKGQTRAGQGHHAWVKVNKHLGCKPRINWVQGVSPMPLSVSLKCFFFLIVCFTSYLVAVIPHSPGVVYYHLLLRRETRIPGVASEIFLCIGDRNPIHPQSLGSYGPLQE